MRRSAASDGRNALHTVGPAEFESNINWLSPPSLRPHVPGNSRNVRFDYFGQPLKAANISLAINDLLTIRQFLRQDTIKEWVHHGGRMIRRSPITVKGCLDHPANYY